MKITAVETIRVAEFANVLWVQVHTDTGISGLGETLGGAGGFTALLDAPAVHLSLSAPNVLIQESVRAFHSGWYEELVTHTPDTPVIDNGYILPPQGVGLGSQLKDGIRNREDATFVVSGDRS